MILRFLWLDFYFSKKLNHEIDVMIATNGVLGGKTISNLTKKDIKKQKKLW